MNLLQWLARRMGPWRLLSLALLLTALCSVASGLADVIRELDARLALMVAVTALLIGWGLAATPLPGWAAGILASVFGLGGIFVHIGRLGRQLVALLPALAELGWGVFYWPHEGLSLSWMPTILALSELWGDLSALLIRVRDWALELAAGQAAFDPVATALMWSLALWAVSGWAGWTARRHQRPLHSLAPATVLLTATLAYVGGSPYVLLVLLGTMLLLLMLVGYDLRVRRWQATRIDFADLSFDTAAIALLLSLSLVAVAAVAPSLSIRKAIEFVQRLDDERMDNVEAVAESLGMEQQREQAQQTAFDEMRAAGLPRRHLLGSGSELSEQVVMIISAGDLAPHPPQIALSRPLPRYYWRGLTYDRYVPSGWYAGTTETVAYGAGTPAITTTLTTQRTVRQEVQVVGDARGLLYAAGALVVADQDYTVAWRSPEDAFAATIEATTYRADSLVPIISEESLRSAGSDYPQWVQDRYLDLPDATPDRVLSLARDLTATAPTPYDRAKAIETYLRAFPYTLDVPEPPTGRDVVDYFLFDLQKGYCDYYATAMVVLARSAGLPARLAVGYAAGFYDSYQAHYVVTEADAHAWVEIYFPGYDWVEFEPTGGLPPIERSAEAASLEWPEPEGTLEPAAVWWSGLGWSWRLTAPALLALLVLPGVVWLTVDAWRLRRMKPAAAVATIYRRLRRHGPRLAIPMRAADTPYEFAALFTGRLEGLAQRKRWGKVFAPAVQELHRLIELYVLASYSPRLPDAADRTQAIQTWRKLRWRLWLAWVWRNVKRREVHDAS
jgi:transglutaminase-like putative cysteine protease